MNHGAKKAEGDFLWFLHADSRLPGGTLDALLERLDALSEAIWYFDLEFRPDGPGMMCLNTIGVWIRCRYLKMPFGDQGFVISKQRFARLGGYPEEAKYGEDHLLVWKARQAGVSIKPLGMSIQTSARKYKERGWLKTTLKHVWLTWRQAIPELVKLVAGTKP